MKESRFNVLHLLNKGMEGEGTEIAEFLNAAGISCFVLWYRSYPYRAPVMFRDCQRAIRYVRYHAQAYGINADNIGIMGFSAGGNLCGTTVEIYRNSPVDADGYVPDEIDSVSAEVKLMGLIYLLNSKLFDVNIITLFDAKNKDILQSI